MPFEKRKLFAKGFGNADSAPQGYELALKPQSGRGLEPKQSRGVTQAVEVYHAGDKGKKVQSIKLRFKLSYTVGAEARNEVGEIPEFSIA